MATIARDGWTFTGRMGHDPRGNTWTWCDMCNDPHMLGQLKPHRCATGTGTHMWDARPKTDTGGRIGAKPDMQRGFHTTYTNYEYVCPKCRAVR